MGVSVNEEIAGHRRTCLCRYSGSLNKLRNDNILSFQGLNMRPCSTVMHLLLRCMRGCGRHGRSRMPRRLRRPLSYIKLIFKSLYFNSLTNSEVVMDSILEPVFWMVEVVTRWFGMVNLSFHNNFLKMSVHISYTLCFFCSL